MRVEVRLAGFGGQGIIRAGLILATAACIYENKNAVQTQSYGPESRGGACRSEVVISEEAIDYPKVIEPNIVIVMSQEAYNTYAHAVKKGGILFLDPSMAPNRKPGGSDITEFLVPAMEIAEKLGKKIVANVVMLGALVAVTNLVNLDSFKKSLLSNIPKGTEELNLSALENGYEYGRKLLEMSSAD